MEASKSHRALCGALLALAFVAPHAGPLHAQQAPADPAVAAPAAAGRVVQALYVEIPSGSALTNAMMAPAIGTSPAVKQLIQVMALGENADLQVVVFSGSEKLALKAAEAALKSFEGKRLEHLTLGVVAEAGKLEALRPLAEPLGVTLVAAKPLR
ncbi:hypothetical protein P6166_01350 [Stenotrophomonas sp. HITSZ_GD]|uniref:hypothetical protein n=1 Tax=Stenotrophomonas sp. HITSZ_GD TaxID=3037248 RepID=UPI00240D630D|nr:hypothetical protein [Stenotrophomonas sp. HITSZ_GD]MDG2524009.1 hypothetical protein [Stenotrophomonas sp. HITSZ_GD]